MHVKMPERIPAMTGFGVVIVLLNCEERGAVVQPVSPSPCRYCA